MSYIQYISSRQVAENLNVILASDESSFESLIEKLIFRVKAMRQTKYHFHVISGARIIFISGIEELFRNSWEREHEFTGGCFEGHSALPPRFL